MTSLRDLTARYSKRAARGELVSPTEWAEYAYAALAAGDVTAAEAAVRKAIARAVDAPVEGGGVASLAHALASVCACRGDYGKAVAVCGVGLHAASGRADLWALRAAASSAAGRFHEASLDLDTLCSVAPRAPLAVAHRAMVRLQMGERRAAWDDAVEALRLLQEHDAATGRGSGAKAPRTEPDAQARRAVGVASLPALEWATMCVFAIASGATARDDAGATERGVDAAQQARDKCESSSFCGRGAGALVLYSLSGDAHHLESAVRGLQKAWMAYRDASPPPVGRPEATLYAVALLTRAGEMLAAGQFHRAVVEAREAASTVPCGADVFAAAQSTAATAYARLASLCSALDINALRASHDGWEEAEKTKKEYSRFSSAPGGADADATGDGSDSDESNSGTTSLPSTLRFVSDSVARITGEAVGRDHLDSVMRPCVHACLSACTDHLRDRILRPHGGVADARAFLLRYRAKRLLGEFDACAADLGLAADALSRRGAAIAAESTPLVLPPCEVLPPLASARNNGPWLPDAALRGLASAVRTAKDAPAGGGAAGNAAACVTELARLTETGDQSVGSDPPAALPSTPRERAELARLRSVVGREQETLCTARTCAQQAAASAEQPGRAAAAFFRGGSPLRAFTLLEAMGDAKSESETAMWEACRFREGVRLKGW